jgi:hypothetical protein
LVSESVTVTEGFIIVMRATFLLVRCTGVPVLAVLLALLTVTFCLADPLVRCGSRVSGAQAVCPVRALRARGGRRSGCPAVGMDGRIPDLASS